MGDLKGKIALVTGASRGVGRGIAYELGAAGASVFVTGRSVRGQQTDNLPGTIQDAAELVDQVGGNGFAIRCDHTDDRAVEEMAETVRKTCGRLDILVNNVWGGYEQYDTEVWALPPWKQPIWRWDKMFETGVRAHYTTTHALLPLLLEGKDPLIVNISAGDRGRFLGDVQYDVAKAAIDRLGFALARKLKPYHIPVVTVHPGFTRTERVIETVQSSDQLANSHSPRFVGRTVVALATDPEVMNRTGGIFRAGELGHDYSLMDIDGSRPEPFEIPDVD